MTLLRVGSVIHTWAHKVACFNAREAFPFFVGEIEVARWGHLFATLKTASEARLMGTVLLIARVSAVVIKVTDLQKDLI